MTNIYTNTAAFGLMPEAQQAALRNHQANGGTILYYDSVTGWVTKATDNFYNANTYRAIPVSEQQATLGTLSDPSRYSSLAILDTLQYPYTATPTEDGIWVRYLDYELLLKYIQSVLKKNK